MKIIITTAFCVVWASLVSGQVTSVDSVTNEPLNAINNVIKGNTSSNITLGAYAQIDYNQPVGEGRNIGKMDIHRLVTFMGYRFNDRTHFVSEIEFEHVSEVYVEQAFINYNIHDAINFRAGLLLIPMGIINEYHEPTTYNGVERPNLEGKVIPTTWREMGIGFSGNLAPAALKYQVYLVNGFNGYDGSGHFRGSDGFRKGRQKAAESYISSPNLSVKLDYYGVQGLKVGAALYSGKSQSTLFRGISPANETAWAVADSSVVNILMAGLDARYQLNGITARAMWVNTRIGNTPQYNAFTGSDLGSRMSGWYLEAGYDVLRLAKIKTDKRLVSFVRYEKYDTHKDVETPLQRNAAYNRTEVFMGVGFYLAPGAVLKADYQLFGNGLSVDYKRQLNFGIGIWF